MSICDENGVLYVRPCSSTLRACTICVLFCNTTKSICTLPHCTQNLSLLRTHSVFLNRANQPQVRMCCCNTWPQWNPFQPAVLQSFSAIIQVFKQLQLVAIDFENITVNYSRFFFLLAWKDTVEAECLQLFTAWASCYISRVCVFRATASIQPVFSAPTQPRKIL